MRQLILVIVFGGLLAGCGGVVPIGHENDFFPSRYFTPEACVKDHPEGCTKMASMGYHPDFTSIEECRRYNPQGCHKTERPPLDPAAAAILGGMLLQNQQRLQQSPPVNCTSNRIGNQVYTHCN